MEIIHSFTSELLKGDINSVPYIVICLVAIIFLYYSFKLLIRGFKIKTDLEKSVEYISKINMGDQNRGNLNSQLYDEIDKFFKNYDQKSKIRHYWLEFSETLVRKGDIVYNTLDSEHFFSHDNIIEQPLGIDFTKNLPGIFTALGIMGTFLGIYIGLGQASKSIKDMGNSGADITRASDYLNQAVEKLFIHITPAFLASLVAVCCAVLYLFLERKFLSSIRYKLDLLQYELDRVFPRVIHEDVLRDILEVNREQSGLLSDFNAKLSKNVEFIMASLLSKQIEELKLSNKELISSIGVNVSLQLLPVTQNLKEAVEEMKKDQINSTQDTIKQLAEEFAQYLNRCAKGQLDDLAKSISGTSEILNSMKIEMEAFVRTIKDAYSNHLISFSTKNEHFQQTMQNNLDKFSTVLSEKLSKTQQDMTDNSKQAIDKIVDKTEKLIKTSQETSEYTNVKLMEKFSITQSEVNLALEKTVRSLSDTVSEVNSKISNSYRDANNDLTSLVKKTQSNIEENYNQVVEKIKRISADAISEMSEKTTVIFKDFISNTKSRQDELNLELKELIVLTARTNEEMGQRFNETGDLLKSFTNQTHEKTDLLCTTLEKSIGDFSKLINELSKLSENTKEQVKTYDEVLLKLKDSSHNLEQSSTELTRFSLNAREITENIKKICFTLEEQSNISGEHLREVSHTMSTASDRLSGEMNKAINQTELYFGKVDKNLSNFHNRVNSAISEYLRKLDENLFKTFEHLSSSLSELREFGDDIDELKDIMSRLPELLKR